MSSKEIIAGHARRLFEVDGYWDTGLEQVVQAAGVTRGALYHHYRDKAALFRTVHDQVDGGIADRVRQSAFGAGDPWTGLLARCRALFDALTPPETQRILVEEGPVVLAPLAVTELRSFRELEGAVDSAIANGYLADQPVVPITILVWGAISQAARNVSVANAARDVQEAEAAILWMVHALAS